MITKQIGYDAAGNLLDYATPQLFLAAFGVDPDLPLIMVDHITAEIWYADAIQGNIFPDGWVFPAITLGDYMLRFVGMYGSPFLGTAPIMLVTTGSYAFNFFAVNNAYYNPVIDNLELDWTVSSYGTKYPNTGYGCSFRNCYIHGNCQIALYLGEYWSVEDCFIIGPWYYGAIYKDYAGDNSIVKNSVLVNTSVSALGVFYSPPSRIYQCTLYSAGTAHGALNASYISLAGIQNSIVCGAHSAIEAVGVPTQYLQRKMADYWQNNCFYGTVGTMSNGNSITQYMPLISADDLTNSETIESNPLLVNPGGTTLADYALQTNSPSRALKKIAVVSVLYPVENMERRTSGAYLTDISNDEILSTAGGNWIKADKNYVVQGHNFGIGGTSEVAAFSLNYILSTAGGNWIDVNVTNVRNGIQWGVSGTSKTGLAYIPSASNVRFGINVDATTGTCYVPTAANVRFGISVDVSDTGLINVPAVGNVLFGIPVDQTTGLWRDVDNADLSKVFSTVSWGISGSRVGTLSPNNVLSTVGGNWYDIVDGDLPKVFPTVNWGVGGTSRVGTLNLNYVLSTVGGNWYDIADINLPKVFSSVTWGVSGSRVGTLSPNNVLNTAGGNWFDITDLSKVFDTMFWGIGGTSRQGTFVPGIPPAIPHLTFTDNLDGSGATATITVSDASAVNRVYTAPYGSGSWTLSGTRTGNGTVNCSLLTGYYWGYLTSSNPNGIVSTIVLLFSVTSPTDPYTRVVPEPFSEGRELPSEPFTFYWYLGELNDTAYGDPEEIDCELNYQDTIICTIDRTGEKTAMEFKNLNLYAKNNKTYLCYVKDRTLTAVNLTGAIGIFTVKVNKSDTAVVLQKRTDVPAQGTIGVAASGEMYFYILPADTATLNVGQQYVFDIKVSVAGKYYTVSEGVILIKQPVNIV